MRCYIINGGQSAIYNKQKHQMVERFWYTWPIIQINYTHEIQTTELSEIAKSLFEGLNGFACHLS